MTMNLLFRIKRLLDRGLEALLVLLFFTLSGCVIIQVFTRYVLGDPAIFTEEVSRYAMIWLSLLGAAYAAGKIEHMAYTMLPDSLSGARLRWHVRSVALIVLAFAASVMCYGGGLLVLRALEFEQLTATLEWPMGYVYLCIPLSGALIVYYQILILLAPEQLQPRSADPAAPAAPMAD
jgi:TRAP-type C4-dicarboxylate transport system permease small subunit